jgi:hypothetical protein
MRDLNVVAISQSFQVLGQLIRERHGRAMDQDRDHWDLSRQGRGRFEPNEVRFVINPSFARAIGGSHPLRPDHRQQYATTCNVVIDCLAKVQSGTDVRNIHEDRILSECANQIVEQPSGFAL